MVGNLSGNWFPPSQNVLWTEKNLLDQGMAFIADKRQQVDISYREIHVSDATVQSQLKKNIKASTSEVFRLHAAALTALRNQIESDSTSEKTTHFLKIANAAKQALLHFDTIKPKEESGFFTQASIKLAMYGPVVKQGLAAAVGIAAAIAASYFVYLSLSSLTAANELQSSLNGCLIKVANENAVRSSCEKAAEKQYFILQSQYLDGNLKKMPKISALFEQCAEDAGYPELKESSQPPSLPLGGLVHAIGKWLQPSPCSREQRTLDEFYSNNIHTPAIYSFGSLGLCGASVLAYISDGNEKPKDDTKDKQKSANVIVD